MAAQPPGPFPLPDVAMECWIIRFDENGVTTSPKTRDALLTKLAAEPARPVIFFSHGWNNDFSDATGLYSRFLVNFEAITRDAPLAANAKPIFVGLTWPSVWLPSDPGPQLAATIAAKAAGTDEAIIAELRRTLPPETDWTRLYALLESDRLGNEEARELAGLIAPALKSGDGEGPKEAAATPDLVLEAMRRLQAASAPPPKDYDLGESGTIGGAPPPAGATPAGLLDFLDPRNALRLASLYIMKDRAGVVGGGGVAQMLREILTRSNAVYLVGHSFGCKVMMSALCASTPPARKAKGALLLQPAISYLSFAKNIAGFERPGAYREAINRVEKPIIVTYSGNDVPLHAIYHLALLRKADVGEGPRPAAIATSAGAPPSIYAALGGYGPRDCDEALLDPMPDKGKSYAYPAGARIVGVDGTAGKRIDSHGGVTTPDTAWALRKLMD